LIVSFNSVIPDDIPVLSLRDAVVFELPFTPTSTSTALQESKHDITGIEHIFFLSAA